MSRPVVGCNSHQMNRISEVLTLTVSSSEFLMAVPSHLLTRIGSSSSVEPAEDEDEFCEIIWLVPNKKGRIVKLNLNNVPSNSLSSFLVQLAYTSWAGSNKNYSNSFEIRFWGHNDYKRAKWHFSHLFGHFSRCFETEMRKSGYAVVD